MTTSPGPPAGLTVGGYELLTRLGEGGMGVVHLARRPGGDRVALKVLRPHIVGDDEARARLAREVNSLSRIQSRWVAEIVDADPWGDIPYVATRYVPGLSLHDLVHEEGPITGRDLDWFARGLAEGIATVHAVGVLHRDVKPSNVLMEGRNPILIDFGLARVADDPKLTHAGFLLGTPGYLAPEILYGDDATPASDVHAWAATVAFAGTGASPFGRGPSMAIMDRVRRGQHDLAGLPADLRRIVEAALDPDPRRRPTLDTLRGWLHSPGQAVVSTGPAEEYDDADPYTVPLALAAQAHERTISLLDDDPDDLHDQEGAAGGTRLLEDEPWPGPARTPVVHRLRRLLLLAGAALAVGAGVAAYPWIATFLLLALTWFLRSASLAASAAGDRRRLRGAKWYDPVISLVGAPWHVVRAIPGTVLLGLWSLGLALAAALICYAAAVDVDVALLVTGLTLAVSLWAGPGGSRVRSPLLRIANPVSADLVRWSVAFALVLAAAAVLAFLVTAEGVNWTPGEQPSLPFVDG